jgi:hypothetical protein
MEGPTFKKTNEPSKSANHKENIEFLNFLLSQEAYQIRKCDETLPIINLMKAPKKRENKEQNGRTHVQEDK